MEFFNNDASTLISAILSLRGMGTLRTVAAIGALAFATYYCGLSPRAEYRMQRLGPALSAFGSCLTDLAAPNCIPEMAGLASSLDAPVPDIGLRYNEPVDLVEYLTWLGEVFEGPIDTVRELQR